MNGQKLLCLPATGVADVRKERAQETAELHRNKVFSRSILCYEYHRQVLPTYHSTNDTLIRIPSAFSVLRSLTMPHPRRWYVKTIRSQQGRLAIHPPRRTSPFIKTRRQKYQNLIWISRRIKRKKQKNNITSEPAAPVGRTSSIDKLVLCTIFNTRY